MSVTVWRHSGWVEDALAVLTWNALYGGLDIAGWWTVEEAIGDLDALVPAGALHLPVQPRPGVWARPTGSWPALRRTRWWGS